MRPDPKDYPWLVGLVFGVTARGAFLCRHDRQLGVCAVCAPVADERYKSHREGLRIETTAEE